MTPTFRIFADTQEITDVILDRFISLSVTDEEGMQSDTAEICLDDRDSATELPPKGANLKILLGYKEEGLVEMGLFTVDEVELMGPPDVLIIKGKSANMRDSLKEQKTRSWDVTTIGDLVAAIAGEHGFEPRVGEFLSPIDLPHLDQTEESDLHLLTRLARQYGAISKPAGNYLLFVPKGEGKSATGKAISPVAINRSEASNHRVTLADRGKYQAVLANWHDTVTGKRISVKVGDEKPVFTLRHVYSDATAAGIAAQAKLDKLKRGLGTLSLTLQHGNSKLAAGAKLTLSGFRNGVDGDWVATRVNHNLSGGGYSSRVDAEIPKGR